MQALGTLAVYLIVSATVASLYPLTRAVHLTVMAGAFVLLLPLLLIPVGSGGILSKKAEVDYTHLSHYQDEEEEQGEEEEQAVASARTNDESSGSGPDKLGLTQPLLEPAVMGMERHAAAALGSHQGGTVDAINGRAAGQVAAATDPASSRPVPEMSPGDCLRSKSFWLLFLILVIGLGSGGRPAHAGATRQPRAAFSRAPWCVHCRPDPPQQSLHCRPDPPQQSRTGCEGLDRWGTSDRGHPDARVCIQRLQLRW